MTAPLDICWCGLARYMLAAGAQVTLVCEHCDDACADRRCPQCAVLSRAHITTTRD